MDVEKTGKLIAMMRREKGLTQTKLADMLGVTDKSVSKWENGVCLPDVSLYKKICDILGITLNEFFAGEKISDENYKEVANENLFKALEESKFSFEEKLKYYQKKWFKENIIGIIISTILWIIGICVLKVMIKKDLLKLDFDDLIGIVSGTFFSSFIVNLLNNRKIYLQEHINKK